MTSLPSEAAGGKSWFVFDTLEVGCTQECHVFITEAPVRGGVGNPRGLTVSVDPGHVAGQVSPGVDTYVMHVMQYVMQYVMLSTRGSEFDPGHTTGRVSPRGFPTPPRTGASVMST